MSTFRVEVVKIDNVSNHPNADRLDLLQIKDWQCVTAKGNFKPGDLSIYLPIDSILPEEIESKIFGVDAKVKLNNSRVRTIKLRGALSQGIAVLPNILLDKNYKYKEGTDLTKLLGITKYEPPVKSVSSNMQATPKRSINPNFKKYGGIENAKNYPNLFNEGEEVFVTEKVHGSHGRCGYVTYSANTLWKKFKKWLGFAPTHEFVFGSNNVQLQDKLLYKGYYDTNIYAEMVKKYNLKEILKPGETIHYEVYGGGVQGDYSYGCKENERKIVCFDVKINDQFLDPVAARHWFESRQLPFVPVLYVGPFSKEKILALRDGASVLSPSQKVREGCVVKPIKEEHSYIGRKFLKFISDDYLLKNQDKEELAH